MILNEPHLMKLEKNSFSHLTQPMSHQNLMEEPIRLGRPSSVNRFVIIDRRTSQKKKSTIIVEDTNIYRVKIV